MKTVRKKTANEPNVSAEDRERLLKLYDAAVANARDLLEEAELLAGHNRYARAAFLAATAYEEMGKAQLVADYAADCSSSQELKKAFADHRTKAAYMMRQTLPDVETPTTPGARGTEWLIVYDVQNAEYHVDLREQALYVAYREQYDDLILPSGITRDECEYVLTRVREAFAELEHAGWLNGRIGSKGLFK